MVRDTDDRVISASYVLTADVLEKYRRDFPAKNALYLLIGGIGLIAFAFFGPPFNISWVTLVTIGIFFILLYPIDSWAQKSTIRRFRLYPKQIAYGFVFEQKGCRLSKDGIEKEHEWSQIYRINQTAAYFEIWRKGHKSMRWLPRSAFASDADIELFLDYARRANVKVSKGSVDGSLIYTLFRARQKRVW